MRYVVLCGAMWLALLLPWWLAGCVPGKAALQEQTAAAGAGFVGARPSAAECRAMWDALSDVTGSGMQLGYMRMQIALEMKGMSREEIELAVALSNGVPSRARAWQEWGPKIVDGAQRAMRAFGCDMDGQGGPER